MDQRIIFNKALINKYDYTGPRYTSYPTAVQFRDDYDAEDYKAWVAESNKDPIPAPLSLYFHIPFCNTVCYYCACNKIVTGDKSRATPYINMLMREIKLHGALFDKDRQVTQMHWGGGTPTFLEDEDILKILASAQHNFNIPRDGSGEYSIEVDPRTVDADRIETLRSFGFNRISFGVQDFDPEVQDAVNRRHSVEQVVSVIEAARTCGFQSINLDLMYGLPKQTLESYRQTIKTTIDASPDRIAVYNYAHLPEMFKPQRRINVDELPSADEKLEILNMTVNELQNAGYVYIGMDHFAKKTDALVTAQLNGTLHRNFQGYSTHAECDLVAMGITAISSIGGNYCQNVKTIEEYEARLIKNIIPVFRGIEPEADDILRRGIINQLLCHFYLDIKPVEERWGIEFKKYFAGACARLEFMEADGLVELTEKSIKVTPVGRLLARNIAMVFDRYLEEDKANNESRFSRVI